MIALRPRLFWLLGPLLAAVPAYAAEGGQKGPSEVIFIAELVLLMLVGRLLGEAGALVGRQLPVHPQIRDEGIVLLVHLLQPGHPIPELGDLPRIRRDRERVDRHEVEPGSGRGLLLPGPRAERLQDRDLGLRDQR